MISASTAVAWKMKKLVQQHTDSKDILELADEVTDIFVAGSHSKYEGFKVAMIDVDATAREELYRRALAIEAHGIDELHKSYGYFTRIFYARRMREIEEATRGFVKIAKVIYEKNH